MYIYNIHRVLVHHPNIHKLQLAHKIPTIAFRLQCHRGKVRRLAACTTNLADVDRFRRFCLESRLVWLFVYPSRWLFWMITTYIHMGKYVYYVMHVCLSVCVYIYICVYAYVRVFWEEFEWTIVNSPSKDVWIVWIVWMTRGWQLFQKTYQDMPLTAQPATKIFVSALFSGLWDRWYHGRYPLIARYFVSHCVEGGLASWENTHRIHVWSNGMFTYPLVDVYGIWR